MLRRIIKILSEKCNGCGLCAQACHEGAIVLKNGKAVLKGDDYCDGLGDCLPACPTGAISFEIREALPYDEEAVRADLSRKASACAGAEDGQPADGSRHAPWPLQIRLSPLKASHYQNADLLIAADCSAYSYQNFYAEFMAGRVPLIGCPKLDSMDYAEKLGQIVRDNDINSLTVTRMSVPCCGGLEKAVARALQFSGKRLPLRIMIITPDGKLSEAVNRAMG